MEGRRALAEGTVATVALDENVLYEINLLNKATMEVTHKSANKIQSIFRFWSNTMDYSKAFRSKFLVHS